MALLLDLANIVGGFLLAIALLSLIPRAGDDLRRIAERIGAFGWLVGIVALVTGGYYLIVHLISGPQVFHFEVVGIGVGIALLWDRLTGRAAPDTDARTAGGPSSGGAVAGARLLLAIFGVIAIIVGIQGLFTPDG
ncbi:hypothetical protein [Plantactinospora sp. KBS50]|uniref:hypothetical protein n=1 Tax=Plantactinospora sp. KBS50 TaxID=2024580 RepID=UPI001E6324CE|nr:hypothetical protein [Plantactinospora sp. KBS50]